MSAPKRILIPIDFSASSLHSIEYAAEIAQKIDAELHILHVVETYDFNAKVGVALDYKDALTREAEGILDDFRNQHTKMWGLPMHTHLRNGKTYSEIIRMSKVLRPEFIVMSTHGASGMGDLQKYFLGSNAYRVVNHAKCPVLTIRKAKRNPTFKNILVPIDVTTHSEQKVERAIRWAKAFGSTIHAISISERVDAIRLKGRKPEFRLERIVKQIQAAGVPCKSAAFHNKPVAETVLGYAVETRADVIFIMTHRERGSTTKFLGSTARNIVENSPVPVLSVHPTDKLVQTS
jgi:nucleotide-binding universal stress UspA family protein